MYPDLFGIDNFSYILMIVIGVAFAIFWLVFYLKRRGFSRNTIIDVIACTLFTVALGIIGAMAFQNIYDLIKDPANYKFSFSMTFYGGLISGTVAFILIFFFFVKKHNDISFGEILIVAPLCITCAHAFGRIGCFLAGCCYGQVTDSCIGVEFPNIGKRIPTQLFESGFLFLLSAALFVLIFVVKFKYTMHVYLASYSIFRFIIEFFRGDEARGGTVLGLYPSQLVCIFIWIIFVPTLILVKKKFFNEPVKDDKE